MIITINIIIKFVVISLEWIQVICKKMNGTEIIVLTEINKPQKAKYHIFLLMCEL
jgi:hypothetical protein